MSLSERMSKAMVSKDRSANLERSLLPSPSLLLRTPSESLDAPDGTDLPRHDDALHDEYFSSKAVLSGHEAAVYAVQFSPTGRSLASTSLDKTVRAWSSNGSSDNVVLGRHDMAGTDVRWLKDDLVASSSLDQTVCFWSFPKGDCLSSYKLDSHALCLASGTSEHLVFAGVSSGAVFVLDSRSPVPNVAWRGDSSANALAYHADRGELFVGDSKGQMTVLDGRQFGVIAQVAVSETSDSKPISGITCSASLVACNSYDAVLRIFDVESRTLLHSLRGHHNRNWPIRSVLVSSGSSDYIASGSASHSCYLYGPLRSKQVSPTLIQKLKGHGGNVYATDYCKDTLVSCSADATIRLWRKSFASS